MRSPLDPDRATMERWLSEVGARVLDDLAALPTTPACGPLGADALAVAERVSVPIPEEPLAGGLSSILDRLGQATAASLTANGPGYLAYIPGGGLYAAALADFIACCNNRFTGLSAAAPALCRLEADVLTWLCREVGWGAASRGLLTSGGSLSIFGAVVTARDARLAGADLRRATAYASSQAHHSVAKAVGLAGIPRANVRAVAVDRDLRLDVAALAEAVAADRAAGLLPFLVVATAGTTNAGVVDPLVPCADLCRDEDLWLHVDGAYGGAFVLCPEGRAVLLGLERADSITLDPHKGLFLPYGTGCLLVRDGELLARAHAADGGYLQDFAALEAEVPSPMQLGPEMSRDFRGLRLWLPLSLHGARAFRDALGEKLRLAAHVEAHLRRFDDVELAAPRDLSLVTFRARRRAGESADAWDERNRRWLAAINGRQRVHLSSTRLPVAGGTGDGSSAFTLRICVLSFRTDARRIEMALEDVAATRP